MSLRHILQRSFVLTNTMRGGGHGWQRPDVPLSPTYVDRRRHRMEDIGYIWMDSAMPQHVLSDNENFLLQPVRGPQRTQKLYFKVFSAIFAFGTLLFLTVNYRKLKFVDAESVEFDREQLRQVAKQRLIHKALANNPYGFDAPFNKWSVGMDYEEFFAREQKWVNTYKQVANEGAQYIKRKLDESRKEVEKGDNHDGHHDHH